MHALVIPTETERKALLRALPCAPSASEWAVPAYAHGVLLVFECGMGPACTEALWPELDRAAPATLWLAGWCGGLREELRVGDLVLADATLSETPAGTARIDHPPPEALVEWLGTWAGSHASQLIIAPALTSPQVLARAPDKRAAAATGAVAVEMEAAPLARWAAARGVPFYHLRIVLDPVGSDLPPEDLHGADEDEGLRRYLWHAVRHPRTWPAVWRLLDQARRARRTMSALGTALTAPGGPLGTAR